MQALWLSSILLLLLWCNTAAAQQQDFYEGGPGENWNFTIIVKGGTSTTNTNSGDPSMSNITALGGGVGDVAIFSCACTDSSAPATCAITGPTGIANLTNTTQGFLRFTTYYVIGTAANIGTNATCTNPGSNSGATTSTTLVFRGVTQTVPPTDATSTTANTSSTNPNPASITTVTDGAAVVATCGSVIPTTGDAAVGDITNYATATPGRQANNANDTQASSIASTWVLKAEKGAEDPAAWNAWTSSNWVCATIALKPWR